jgi:hypothetical protein
MAMAQEKAKDQAAKDKAAKDKAASRVILLPERPGRPPALTNH